MSNFSFIIIKGTSYMVDASAASITASDLTLQNVAICPAAYNIVEEMKKKLPL